MIGLISNPARKIFYLNTLRYMLHNFQWVVSDLTCATFGFVAVPLYNRLGTEALTHICKESEFIM